MEAKEVELNCRCNPPNKKVLVKCPLGRRCGYLCFYLQQKDEDIFDKPIGSPRGKGYYQKLIVAHGTSAS
jgi:hypothetical protein